MNIDSITQQEKVKKIIKILVVGDPGTGKTSLIRQYCDGCFSEFYKQTVGVDFASKDIKYSDDLIINLSLWDIYGQERYHKMSRVYFQNAHSAIFVFDILRPTTFDAIKLWKQEIDETVLTSDNKPIPGLLLGNKIDLSNEGKWFKTKEEMDEYVKENNFIGFYETSARDAINIEDAMQSLVKYIIDNNIEPYVDNPQQTVQEDHKKKSCCNLY